MRAGRPPRSLALMLLEHKARSLHTQPTEFVFATRSGRALGQRNVIRALRQTMTRARDPNGRPTFPALHQRHPVARGAVPTFHGFRHTAASQAIHDGDSAEEVSWQLGHRSSLVTRAVYVHEIASAERQAKRRAKLEACYHTVLDAASNIPNHTTTTDQAKLLPFPARSAIN